MSRNRSYPYLTVVNSGKDEIGFYLNLYVELNPNESLSIRCGLDEFTYYKIKNVIETRPFSSLPGLKYTYQLLLTTSATNDGEKRHDFGNIECKLDKEYKNIEFECSELFASNIAWFRDIKSINELKHIEIKSN
jgi:hypothetical protein